MKTGYKKFCSTIKDKECYTVHKTTSKTVYQKESTLINAKTKCFLPKLFVIFLKILFGQC